MNTSSSLTSQTVDRKLARTASVALNQAEVTMDFSRPSADWIAHGLPRPGLCAERSE